MRWEALFADLEVQTSALRQEEFEFGVAETIALEWSRAELTDRLRGHIGEQLAIRLRGGEVVPLEITAAGSDWVSGVGRGHQWLMPVAVLELVSGMTRRVQVESSPARRRLGIASPLRALAEADPHIAVHCASGVLVEGRLLGIGRDFLDIRPEGQFRRVQTVPLPVMTAVRSARV
ncbi:hypothetical protein [Nesterenkonia natronophila]|uniref:Uncharacterized protein n=1 Tax=Nesterenkonia natronophila TaxID=2174932 RepID=A0A3A4F0V1_9MICC|nr:hypothetical protein [Nesterenkonia natronophila]RJN31822.1 hypothetical protein D3250_06785 [Nesterenkonia natronophila]